MGLERGGGLDSNRERDAIAAAASAAGGGWLVGWLVEGFSTPDKRNSSP